MHTLQHHAIPGRLKIIAGKGGLPVIQVESDWSQAEIYPHGAHVTSFQMNGEAPLLFMSAASEFHTDKPIRGGVPVIFPWFGAREGLVFHGFARLAAWDLVSVVVLPDGSMRLHFQLPSDDECEVDYFVTVGASLTLELVVTNTSIADFTFENCLHTYFLVGAIDSLAIAGLHGTRYRDQLLAAEFTESAESIRFTGEVDRVYQDSGATVEIHDPALHRSIRVRKSGSQSTVIWNPWITKSQRLPDFADDEYRHMVCVESGNIAPNSLTLAPGEISQMTVEIASVPLD